jgi:hypothetical protein
MAISYLSSIALNNNQLKTFKVDNQASDPSVTGVGQMIFDTTNDVLKYHTSGGWQTVSSGMVTWILKGDSGSDQTIGDGQSATIAGESGFISTTAGATRTVTITMDDNAPSAAAGSVAYPASISYNKKGQITAVTASTEPITGFDITDGTNTQTVANGNTITFAHNTGLDAVISATDTVTYNLQLQDLPDMTQTWVAADEFIVLDGTDQKRKAGNEIPINLLGTPSADLAMGNNKITGLAAPTANADAATKQYVDNAVVGSLQIKGGFNANTGAIDGSPSPGNLTTGGSRVAIAVGDFYVVTTAGDFYGDASTPLTVGDQVICNTAAAAGSSVIGDWVVVQSDTDLATATTVGLASFPTTGGLTVNASGAVSLDTQTGVAGSYGAVTKSLQITADGKGIITGIADADIAIPSTQITDFCTAVETCVGSGLNYAANIGDGSATSYAVTHGLGTRDVIVQVYDNTTYDTVICDVVRTSTTVVTLSTTTALASNAARVLITVS